MNLKHHTNEHSQTQRTDWWWPKGRGLSEGCGGRLELADASFYIENKQQGPTV